MIRKIITNLFAVLFAIAAAPVLSAMAGVAGAPDPVIRNTDVVSGAPERKQEAARITEKRTLLDDAKESVDCFYESNRSDQDCSDSKSVAR